MAADSRINIVLDVDTRNTEQIEATAARLTSLGRAERNVSADTDRLSGRMGELDGRMGRLTRSTNALSEANQGLIKHARKLMYLVIGLGIEFLAVTVALVSVNAAFAVGNAVVKLYNWAMQGLAGTVAAVGAAAITAAAAFQEFNAAAYAFRYKESAVFGSALSQSADALRTLQVNSTLASYGITALGQAYASFNKNAKMDAKSVKQLEMMSDFGTGPNRAKSLAASAEYLSLLKKRGRFTAQTRQLAAQIGPEFEKVSKKYSDPKKLLADLQSGALAKAAGVEGVSRTMGQTLFGQLKSYLVQAFVEASDAGKYLLEPVKESFHTIFMGLMRSFRMIRGDLINFGRGGLLGALEELGNKTETFAIKLFREFLPAAAGWWKRTGDFFEKFVNDFKDARDMLESMRAGGSVVIKMFGEPLAQIFIRIGKNAQEFAKLAETHKEDFLAFGNALKNVVDGFFNIGNAVRKAFTVALPIITQMVNALGGLFNGIAKMIDLLSMLGPIGGTMTVAGLTSYALKGRRSARFERRRAMAGGGGGGPIYARPNTSPARIMGRMGNAGGGNDVVGPYSGGQGQAQRRAGVQPIYAGTYSMASHGDRSHASGMYPTTSFGTTYAGAFPGNVQLFPDENGNLVAMHVAPTMPSKSRLTTQQPGQRGYIAPYRNLEESGRRWHSGYRFIDESGRHGYMPATIAVKNRRFGTGTLRTDPGERARRQAGVVYNKDGTARIVTAAKAESIARGRELAGRMKEFDKHYNRYGRFHPEDPRAARLLAAGQAAPPGVAGPGEISRTQRIMRSAQRQVVDTRSNISGAMREIRGNVRGFFGRGGYAETWANRRANAMDFMFGPKPSGQPAIGGTSSNRVMAFLSGQGMRTNAATLRNNNLQLLNLLAANKDKAMADRLSLAQAAESLGIAPEDIDKTYNKGKRMTRGKALMKAARGQGSMMGGGMLASIGTGMFLESAAGQKMFSDPNAQKWMGTGAMLMPFNPALGLGVGLTGTAFNAKTTSGGMMSGGGAGLSMMMALGVTNPAVYLAAAAIGATIGAISSYQNKKKMARQGATAIADSKLGEIAANTLVEAMTTGTSIGGREGVKDFKTFVASFDKMDKKQREKNLQKFVSAGIIDKRTAELMTGQGVYGGNAVDRFKKEAKDMEEALTPMFDQFDNAMRGLQLSTGMSSAELMKLAADMNVNLFDPTKTLTQLIAELGLTIVKTAEQFNQALRDISVQSTSVFDTFLKQREMEDSMIAAQKRLLEGDTSTEAFIDYYQKVIDYQNLVAPQAGISNFLDRIKGMRTGEIYGPGGALQGVQRNATFDKLLEDQLKAEQQGIAGSVTTRITSSLAEMGTGFADPTRGREMMQRLVSDLITKASYGDTNALNTLISLDTDLTSGAFKRRAPGAGAVSVLSRYFPDTAVSAGQGGYGNFGGLGFTPIKTGQQTAETLAAMSEGAKEIYAQMTQAFHDGLAQITDEPQWFGNSPSWWTNQPPWMDGARNSVPDGTVKTINNRQAIWNSNGAEGPGYYAGGEKIGGDTSTPRALRATLGAHSRFNSMLPGKRMITSSWREWGLGSPSSDHATGRAYDLTGDNLQQYAKSITDSGGFAEFHGINGQRHLHVVPPIGPIGDRSSPVSMGASASTSYSGDSFNITVVESTNAQETAQEVVNRIVELQKQTRRRM